MRAPRPLSIFVALSCGLVGFAPAVQHDQLAPARARWATLDVEQRELAHERFRHLQGMDGEERAAFDRRARELRSLRGELESELSSAERAALEALPYHDRMRLLGEQLRDELSLRGRALRERLPDAVTNELERHLRRGPRDVHSFLAGQRERGSHHLAAQIAAELGRPEEVERLKRLTHEQRADAVMELMKELAIQRTLEQEGALEQIGDQAWEEWQLLDTPRFLKQLELFGPRPEQPFPWRHHRRALGPHPESEASPAERQRMGALGRLLEEARPRMRERLREGRRNERSSVDDAVAERVQTYLQAHPDLLPAGVEQIIIGDWYAGVIIGSVARNEGLVTVLNEILTSEGNHFQTLEVPAQAVGKTVAELHQELFVRDRAILISLEWSDESGRQSEVNPMPDRILRAGERMVVLAEAS